MNDNELITVDDRVYVNPDVSTQETDEFMRNLKQVQQSGLQEINAQTKALGSDLPNFQGGLGGAEGMFTAQYSTPKVAAILSDLRATSQAAALSTAMSNRINALKKQYDDAYSAYKKRQAAKKNNTTPTTPAPEAPKGDVEEETPKEVKSDAILMSIGQQKLDEMIKNKDAPGQKKTVLDTIDWSKYQKIGR